MKDLEGLSDKELCRKCGVNEATWAHLVEFLGGDRELARKGIVASCELSDSLGAFLEHRSRKDVDVAQDIQDLADLVSIEIQEEPLRHNMMAIINRVKAVIQALGLDEGVAEREAVFGKMQGRLFADVEVKSVGDRDAREELFERRFLPGRDEADEQPTRNVFNKMEEKGKR